MGTISVPSPVSRLPGLLSPATRGAAMTANELFQNGRLREAIDVQVAKVKSGPTDRPARFFLFELFLFSGDLDRARKQLDVLRYDDPQHSAAIEQYRSALDAESRRRAVFAGTEQPKVLAAAPDHVRQRLDALPYLARGEKTEARKRLDEANAAVPSLTGAMNGKPFEGLYDADERFGTVIEVFGTGGVYTWVPLEQIESITMNPPRAPRDVIWRPANVTLSDGLSGDVLIPGLYPDTHLHADDAIRLGRGTEWLGDGHEVARGVGGKMLLTAAGPISLTSVLQIARPAPSSGD
jgi:type VI secretion system protein ImpE